MIVLEVMGQKAKNSAIVLAELTANDKNKALKNAADALEAATEKIITENKKDIDAAHKNGMKASLIDRLSLDESRVKSMADGLRHVAGLHDPVGEIINMQKMENGLLIGQKRVPMGVIGIIYESRPNVTADAFGLCLKAGSATILRGGSDAINSNKIIVEILRTSLEGSGIPIDCIQIVEDTSRETANEMMKLNKYIDVLIPRGGSGLIQTVVQNSTVPVIETGIGNCHVFVDESANLENALKIIINAKTQRTGVCNACESILIHENIADKFLPDMGKTLIQKNVEIHADEKGKELIPEALEADEQDWGKEYLDLIVSVKIVSSLEEAIKHIRKYGTGHSEAIVTENYTNAQKFLDAVDAAAVYVNASTRFTDGSEFGFGAEIGISTQKLHARGPMGLKELTTTKYIIYGNGHIRD